MLTVDANVWVTDFDPRDALHDRSAAFLREAARRRLVLHSPSFLTLEVACAVTRRAGDSAVGVFVGDRLLTHPTLELHPLDDRLLDEARNVGVQLMLRGADALYAATAKLTGAPLITWDHELVKRAGGVTPESWLTENL